MFRSRRVFLIALVLSLALHVSLMPSWWGKPQPPKQRKVNPPKLAGSQALPDTPPPPQSENVPASMPAPPAPTAEEWQLAATYTPRNSKRYRHTWGQQVRSMMGTAVEGPDQALVRFRIEIAPDGKIAKVEDTSNEFCDLWSASARSRHQSIVCVTHGSDPGTVQQSLELRSGIS